jgi:hypothetical protein
LCHHGWNYDGGVTPGGTINTWNGGVIPAIDMIEDLIALFVPFFLPSYNFDFYTIYTMASPTAEPVPVFTDSLNNPGTSIETEWAKAVQTTFSFGTEAFGQAKLIFLDAPAAAGFDKILSFGASAEALAILDMLKDEDRGWQARDQSRITVLKQITYTLNEKLRREFNMT